MKRRSWRHSWHVAILELMPLWTFWLKKFGKNVSMYCVLETMRAYVSANALWMSNVSENQLHCDSHFSTKKYIFQAASVLLEDKWYVIRTKEIIAKSFKTVYHPLRNPILSCSSWEINVEDFLTDFEIFSNLEFN